MSIRPLATIGAAVILSLVAAPVTSAQEFGRAPLRAPTAFPTNSLPTEAGSFMSWLISQPSALSGERLIDAHEQLFAIISADAKQRERSGGPVFPRSPDPQLARLYEWGNRLGLPGSRLVAQRLGFEPGPTDAKPIETPGFTIELDSLYTLTGEADGWAVRFPHYFMIGATTRQRLDDGAETSIAVVSTLFAKDSAAHPGASQATIMLLSANLPAPRMTGLWLGRLGIAPTDTVANMSTGAVRSYRVRDSTARMTRELVVFMPEGRTILAAYIGNDGSYETNRPHFLDLLETLRVAGRMP